MISANRDKLNTIAKALLEFETLDGGQVHDITKSGGMSNPPARPAGRVKAEPAPEASPADPQLDLGGLSGAPA